MRVVSDKASRDAWIMLACAVDDALPKRLSGTSTGHKDNPHRVQRSSGHGYRMQDSMRCTEKGKQLLNLTGKSTLGCTPAEYRYTKER